MNIIKQNFKIYIFISFAAALLFIPFIGNMPLFDWDEVNFAECAREMMVSNNFSEVQLYFQPFWEKPPLFIWLQAMSMKLFGINEMAARFPNALCGIFTLITIFKIGQKINDTKFGLLWVVIYASTLLPHFYFKSGIIDPWFNFFIFLSVYQLILHTNNPSGREGYKTAITGGLFLGLSLLTKGPAALLIVSLTVAVFIGMNQFKKISHFKYMFAFFIAFMISGFSWFLIELIKGNVHIIKEFVEYQVRLFKTEDSDHGGSFFYHFIVLLLGCFPSSLFLILAHQRSNIDTPFQKHSKKWMLALFWVVLILFSIVKTKIVHYSSLTYFPLTYLATYSVVKLLSGEYKWKKWLTISFTLISFVLGLVFTLTGGINFLKPYLLKPGLIEDTFALENIKADVAWQGWEWLIGLFFMLGIIFSVQYIIRGYKKFIFGLFATSLTSIIFLILFITPKVEQYSQHAAIDFYKYAAQKNYYVETIGFKSYAFLFYGQVNDQYKKNQDFLSFYQKAAKGIEERGESVTRSFSLIMLGWLAEGKIEKPALFVTKINKEEEVKKYFKKLHKLYSKNGYTFYIRYPEKQI